MLFFLNYKKYVGILLLLFLLPVPLLAEEKLIYDIKGIDQPLLKNVSARLITLQKSYGSHLTERAVNVIYHSTHSEIKKALEPYGFFKSSIRSVLIKKDNKWYAIYYIALGPPLRIGSIDIKVRGPGAKDPNIARYLKKPDLKKGQIFNTENYDQFKTKLFQIAKNQGYLKAHFKNKIQANLNKMTCRMDITLMTGPQMYFGRVTFKTSPYSQNFMQKFIDFRRGDIFSSDKLLTLQQQMEQSYYFNRAIFDIDVNKQENFQIPVDIYLYPPKSQSYSGGIGYGTLTGMRLSGAMSLRHLGAEGHHLEAEATLSSILSEMSVTYFIPGKDPLNEEWSIGTSYKHFSPKAGESDSINVMSGYTQKWGNWQIHRNLNYLLEHFIVFSHPPRLWSQLFYPSWKITYLKTDHLINPQNGFSFNLIFQGGTKALFSSNNFLSLKTRIKYLISPSDFNRIILRAEAGVIDASQFYRFPLSMRFFAGGINSIRGFGDSDIGPGKYLGIASAEYQQRVKGNLFGAIFYDVGNATNHVQGRLNQGVGTGIVYVTQMGAIKIYIAKAISKKNKPNSIEFSIGPEFS